MSDLTNILPQDSQTVTAIYEAWKRRGDAEPKRGYLGGSAIGEPCERRLWYNFRDCAAESFEGRLYRLFNRGHREEVTFTEDLKAIGCEVYEVNPQTGEQFAISLFGGHFKGHADGVALGIPEAPKTWHLLEMKTSNAKSFKTLTENGVEKDKPIHFAQMQIYMSELKLTRALYIVVNKETDELYSERIRYDAAVAQSLKDKAERIIFASKPPERISDRADAFVCKWCPAKELCHGTGEMAVPIDELSCRQCCHATPERNGNWTCAAGQPYGNPCERHLMLPGLVNFANPQDGFKNADGSDVIEFLSDDGTIWHHGPNEDAGQFSSRHLISMPKSLITLPRGEDLQEGGQTQPNLLDKWQLGDGIERVWMGKAEELQSVWCQHVPFPLGIPTFTQDAETFNAADFGTFCAIIYPGQGKAEIRKDTNQ